MCSTAHSPAVTVPRPTRSCHNTHTIDPLTLQHKVNSSLTRQLQARTDITLVSTLDKARHTSSDTSFWVALHVCSHQQGKSITPDPSYDILPYLQMSWWQERPAHRLSACGCGTLFSKVNSNHTAMHAFSPNEFQARVGGWKLQKHHTMTKKRQTLYPWITCCTRQQILANRRYMRPLFRATHLSAFHTQSSPLHML